MATSALFVELLIVGLEALVWMGLLVLCYTGPLDVVATLGKLKEWATPLTALVFVAAYVIGILMDRVSDTLYVALEGDPTKWRALNRIRRIFRKKRVSHSAIDKIPEMRLQVMLESEGLAKFLDYQRSRLRIARATVLNLLLAIVAAVIYQITIGAGIRYRIALVVLGSFVWLLVLLATEMIDFAHLKRLSEAYDLVLKKAAAPSEVKM